MDIWEGEVLKIGYIGVCGEFGFEHVELRDLRISGWILCKAYIIKGKSPGLCKGSPATINFLFFPCTHSISFLSSFSPFLSQTFLGHLSFAKLCPRLLTQSTNISLSTYYVPDTVLSVILVTKLVNQTQSSSERIWNHLNYKTQTHKTSK